ncbi:universal stress protein [Actinoplanes teichomyceticus]|uniref:Nucleotide-binding universal stress UspA family protein n=1 Tax=Actinoplanes teichomyceticus TaxID=1867 RepID=A0A561WK99_ACTTI|nr:universal stress protein [Actinoplanes teichomyceticus]TWG24278.1 nucleotide-binding universal stress UspA family protein [Actinoplanes teichomyceticus]GIF12876.1 hypothetical protein Ate01nite_29080 [Actinoplanes teichomyceticus]
MRNIEQFRDETAARRTMGGVNHFGDMINRYLGAVSYPDPYAAAPARAPAAKRAAATLTAGTVLVGVDDSLISTVAVDHAAIEAELHGWALRLVTIQHTGADEAGETLLRRLTDRVHASAPAVPVTSRLTVGARPAPVLLATAADADLLVVGHRHGAATTALGRSVADRVCHGHPGPVLVVRMPDWPAGPEFGTRPLAVAVDGSPAARVAEEFAYAEARVRGCEVTLLHVVGDRMDLARRQETRDGVPVHHRIVSGDPVSALVEESARAAAVVIARHRHDVLNRTLLGPATHVLPQRALCPVFLVG